MSVRSVIHDQFKQVAQEQEQQQRIGDMEKEIGKVMAPGVKSIKLKI